MLEKDIEQILVQGIKKHGGVAYKWVSPGNSGVPDRMVVLPEGRVMFVELKTANGRLSELQKRQQERLRKLGCDVYTLYGKDDVLNYLERKMDN